MFRIEQLPAPSPTSLFNPWNRQILENLYHAVRYLQGVFEGAMSRVDREDVVQALTSVSLPDPRQTQSQALRGRPFFKPKVLDDVVLTGRTFFLNQEASHYGKGAPIGTGSLSEHYSLSLEKLDGIVTRRGGPMTVMGLASGSSVFPEELVALYPRMTVHCVDLNMGAYKVRMKERYRGTSRTNLDHLKRVYLDNMGRVAELLSVCPTALPREQRDSFERFYQLSERISSTFFAHDRVTRTQGNALELTEHVERDSVDLLLNCWMLNYLSDEDRRRVFEQCIAVVRVGGECRFQGGTEQAYGGFYKGDRKGHVLTEDTFKNLFKDSLDGNNNVVVSSKTVIIDTESSQEGRLVFRVAGQGESSGASKS